MRFFGYEHNLRQLNEQLLLYKIHLHIDPAEVKVFWPPERVWDTERMAPVLLTSACSTTATSTCWWMTGCCCR